MPRLPILTLYTSPLMASSFLALALLMIALGALMWARLRIRGRLRRAAHTWPRVPGEINHVYPASFGRRIVLKLDCSFPGADGTLREKQHEFVTPRAQRDSVMEALYGAAVAFHVNPSNETDSVLLRKDIERILQGARGPARAEFPHRPGHVDLAHSTASH